MRRLPILLPALAGVILICSCSGSVLETPFQPADEMDCIRFSVADYRWNDITKTQAQKQDGGVVFTWSEKDTVGICPDAGAQVYFAVQNGAGSGEAVFDGGGWALKRNHSYAAYYPYNRYNFESCNIPLLYGTRHQTGNDNLDGIAQYDYMASKMTVPSEGEVNFQFQHLAALVRFKLTIPEGAQFTEFILTAEQSAFPTKQILDLTGEEPLLISSETSGSIKIELNGISLSESGEIVLYALIPPVNLNGKTLTVLLNTPLASQAYTAQITGKDFQAGNAYSYTSALTRTFIPQYVDLGLSVKWATCNVGAMRPEDYGGMFSWGETEPKTAGFSWTNYKYCEEENNKLTKYCYRTNYGYNYIIDDRVTLEPMDDAATVNWGEGWRMPTWSELKELKEKCFWSVEQIGDVVGFRVEGSNGNSIFLPASGDGYRDSISGRGYYGSYWSSTLETEDTKIGAWANPDTACGLGFNVESSTPEQGNSLRSNGCTIRPVCD